MKGYGSIRHRLALLLSTIALLGGGGLVTASTASAAPYGNVYLVVSNANCVGGGTVIYVGGAVDNVWSGGDWGDNVIYPRVDLNRTNTFNGRAYCDRPWWDARGDYWINVVWKQFYPTRTGQTFWF